MAQGGSSNVGAGGPAQGGGIQNGSGQPGSGAPGSTLSLFNTVVVPNGAPFNDCRDQCPGCGSEDSVFSNAQSNHPGGVNVLMADGSARFIKNSISPLTWMQLGTRANGEVISANAY